MSSLGCLIFVLPQSKIALAIFLRIDFQAIVKQTQQMSFKAIDLKCGVRFDDLRKRMIFQTLIIPNLGCLNQSNKNKILPISITNLVLLTKTKQLSQINKRYDRCLLLHLSCHHHQLYKIFYIFS